MYYNDYVNINGELYFFEAKIERYPSRLGLFGSRITELKISKEHFVWRNGQYVEEYSEEIFFFNRGLQRAVQYDFGVWQILNKLTRRFGNELREVV